MKNGRISLAVLLSWLHLGISFTTYSSTGGSRSASNLDRRSSSHLQVQASTGTRTGRTTTRERVTDGKDTDVKRRTRSDEMEKVTAERVSLN